jgi:hypothetical protein
MNDSELHTTLSQCGRAYVEQQHDWRVITNKLVTVYQQAIATHTGGSFPSDTTTSFVSSKSL